MSELMIQVRDVSKLYRLGKIGTGSLRQEMQYWWNKKVLKKNDPFFSAADYTEEDQFIWALKNVSFDINQSDVWGIIGSNGAGKSTLLKILSRIVKPTEGRVRGKGKISSLLEIGTGFHYELTGRENIYLSGHMLGMNRGEINTRFNEIVEFSGIEKFLDTPVKRYSSGMYVRLAFAVAAHLEPDILIVDEVLAVGDTAFQRKCIERIKDISTHRGKTVLFVSHNIVTVEQLCTHALYLDRGKVAAKGSVTKVIHQYLDDVNKHVIKKKPLLAPGIWLQALELEQSEISNGDDLVFRLVFEYELKPEVKELALLIYNSKGVRISMVDLRPYFHKIRYTGTNFIYKGIIKNINLVEGDYYLGLFYYINDTFRDMYDLNRLTIREHVPLKGLKKYDTPYLGLVTLDHTHAE